MGLAAEGCGVTNWWRQALANRLPPRVEGGMPVPVPSYPCPEPGCPVVDTDADTVFLHAYVEHGRDRRRTERRAAA